jgi:hypothetical protein
MGRSTGRASLWMRVFLLLLGGSSVAGCTSIFSVRIPLGDELVQSASAPAHIVIDDRRPASERKVHTGGGLSRCERWYGDDTYVPSKLAYLQQLLANRVPQVTTVTLNLRRFDTIEYCDNTANRGAAAAAAGAGGAATGTAVYIPPQDVPGGDSVLVRLAGEINGVSFDLSRRFDYSDLPYNSLSEMPGDNPSYRARMTSAMEQIADELAVLAATGTAK